MSKIIRDAILSDNNELRKNPDALRKLDTMEWALSIPEDDYARLIKINPGLVFGTAETRAIEWKKFIKSDISIPYRVRPTASRIKYGSNSQK